MKLVDVVFQGNSQKVYTYKTNLNLILNGVYEIVADNETTYTNPVKVISITEYTKKAPSVKYVREITKAKLVEAPSKPTGGIERVVVNPEKKATAIIWVDGTKTVVKCQDGEEYDAEKGIALCFMKRAFHNRGCFNDIFRKWIPVEEEEEVNEQLTISY